MWQVGQTLAQIEKETILQAMGFYQGNKNLTAQVLGISLRTLYNKLREYGMLKEGEQDESPTEQSTAPTQSTQPGKPVHGVYLSEGNGAQPSSQASKKHNVSVRESKKV